MAKIKINGDSSGYVEIAAPNAAHNNTLELGPGTKILTDKNTHTGNIGIGTDNPGNKLDVIGGNIRVGKTSNGQFIGENNSGTVKIKLDTDGVSYLNGGNVGVGTDNPNDHNNFTKALDINGPSGSAVYMRTNGSTSNCFIVGNYGSDAYVNNVANGNIRFYTQGTEKFRISNTGLIGIGTIAPTGNFEVHGNDGINISNSYRTGTNGVQWRLIPHNGGSGQSPSNLRLYEGAGATEVINITKTGRIGVNRMTPSFMMDIVGNSSTGANCIRIVDGAETGHGSHPAKIVAGGTYYHEMQMHSRRFTVHTWNGSNIAERFRVHQDGTIKCGTSSVLKAEINNAVSGHQFISQCSDNNNGFEVYQQHGSNTTRNTFAVYANTGSSNAKNLQFAVRGDGAVTKPGQPAFKAKLNTATGANFSGVLVFNNVSFNVGSHYNSSNGRFTAPVDGRYLFCWYDNVELATSAALYVDWMINGNTQGNRIYTMRTTGWEGLAGSIIFDLNTNDYVQIYAYSSGNYDGGLYGAFSGCLLG